MNYMDQSPVFVLVRPIKIHAMITTIIFDVEGVVVDTETIWDLAQEEFLRRRGFTYDRDRIKHKLTGKSMAEGIEILKEEYGIRENSGTLARERMEIVKTLLQNNIRFIDGFLEFFERVRNTKKTCVATAMDPELLEIVGRQLRLSELFDGRIFSLRDVEYRSKPNPDLFLYAAGQLNSRAENCVVIEDSPHGVEAAKRAGMKCVGLTTTYDRQMLSEADLIADSYSQIDLGVLG